MARTPIDAPMEILNINGVAKSAQSALKPILRDFQQGNHLSNVSIFICESGTIPTPQVNSDAEICLNVSTLHG